MASKIKGITIEIGGNTTKLGKALDGVEKQSKSLQSEFFYFIILSKNMWWYYV